MNGQGILSYDGKTIDTKDFNRYSGGFAPAHLVGAIPCGPATEEEEHVEEYINLPVNLFGRGEFYILRARGDSMEDAGISDGDLVVIRKTSECFKGNIIVALDEENQNTLKRFGDPDRRGGLRLEYMNEEKYPNKVIRVRELTVQGVATHVIKTL